MAGFFSDKQREFLDNANKRWNIKTGATRSGKTYLDYYVIPKRIRRVAGADGLNVMLGNTKGTLTRNIIVPLQKIWGTALVSDIGSDNTAKMFGERVYCLGADKVSQVDKIRGSSIKYCYGDEITTWSEDVFQMLKSRLDKDYSKFDGTCNPESPNHWLKKFLDSSEGLDIYQQHYTIDDNPFLPPAVKENLKKEYAGTVFYDRYILGKWALAEGLIYPMFDKNRHVTDQVDGKGLFYISIDYGTLNPFSMGLWIMTAKRAYRIAEYYWDGRNQKRQKTDEEYYAAIDRLAGDRVIQQVIVDPSAASFIETIRRHGRFTVVKAKNDVLDGIRVVSSMLNAGMIAVSPSCVNTIREFESYAWDDKAGEDKPVKENDHAMDDVRYFCNTILAREYRWQDWRRQTNV